MDIEFELRGIRFRWNSAKAKLNGEKHGVSFEEAAQVFFDPFVTFVEASDQQEFREAALGITFSFRVLFVVHVMVEDDFVRIVSARRADATERRRYEDGDD